MKGGSGGEVVLLWVTGYDVCALLGQRLATRLLRFLYSIARALDSDPSCFHAAVLWLALTSSGAQVNTLRLIGMKTE